MTKDPKLPRLLKLFVPILLLGIIGIFIAVPRPKKSQSAQPKFQKVSSSSYKTSFPSIGMSASLGLESDRLKIEVSRNDSILQLATPLQNASLKQEKETLTYSTPQKGTETRYSALANGLKEEIILRQKPNTNELKSSLNLKNLTVKITPEGIPVFYNSKTKEYEYHFLRPFAKDAKGNVTYGVKFFLRERSSLNPLSNLSDLSNLGGKASGKRLLLGPPLPFSSGNSLQEYALTLVLDQSWLSDPKRVYPIIIDPSVVHDTSSEFAAGTLNRVKDTGSGASPSLETYYQESLADIYTVGLWHMNETANDSCSGGEDACDSSGNGNHGTATGTTITTTGQKLGAAARSFNGTSDYVTKTSPSGLPTGSVATVEAWIKPTGTYADASYNGIVCWGPRVVTGTSFLLSIQNTGRLSMATWGNDFVPTTGPAAVANTWNHAAAVLNGTSISLYLNGALAASGTLSSTPNIQSGTLTIGETDVNGRYFNGAIDEVRISNRALTPEEIKLDAQRRPYSVYTSDLISLEGYAVGWTGLSWTESGVQTGDGETLAVGSTANLVAQWNFNEGSGSTAYIAAGSCGSACNGGLTNFADLTAVDVGVTSGWTQNNKRWGAGALMFDGVNDYVNVGNPTALQFDNTDSFTIAAWVNASSQNYDYAGIVVKQATANRFAYSLGFDVTTSNVVGFGVSKAGVGSNGSSAIMQKGVWNYLVGVYNASTSKVQLYLNGVAAPEASYTYGALSYADGTFTIGHDTGAIRYFKGLIDAVTVYDRALSASEILANYQAGNIEFQTRVGSSSDPNDGTWEAWKPTTSETQVDSLDSSVGSWYWDLDGLGVGGTTSVYMPKAKKNDTITKMEGTASMKASIGVGQTDANVKGFWHLDETGVGTGSTAYDVSGNGNHGVATGTTLADGFSGKARSFNGSSDLIVIPHTSSLNVPTAWTVSSWVKLAGTPSGYPAIFTDLYPGAESKVQFSIGFDNSTRALRVGAYNGAAWYTAVTADLVPLGEWAYVAGVYDGSAGTIKAYINGILKATTTGVPSSIGNVTTEKRIGRRWDTTDYINGFIDEVRISNIARTAEEIAEEYRAGRDHRLSRNISSTDLTSATKLPFYVASDEPGTFMEATVGEGAFANNEPDANTVGLWHLDENNQNIALPVTSGLSLWVKADAISGLSDGASVSTWTDSSSNGRNLTQATGSKQPIYKTNIVNGFPVVRFTAASIQEITNATNFTAPVTVIYVGKQTGGTNGRVLAGVANNWLLGYWGGGKNQGYFVGWVTPAGTPATDTSWHVFSAVETGTLSSVYADGGLVASNAGGVDGPNGISIGCWNATECSNVDVAEVIIYNSALSASDRASVEVYLNAKYNINGGAGMPSYLKDSSGNGNNGAPAGTTFVQGKIGKGRSFNGTSSDYLDRATFTNQPSGNSSFTVCMWLKPNSNSTTQVMSGFGSDVGGGNQGHYTGISSVGKFNAEFGSATGRVTSSQSVSVGQWYHLCAVYNQSNHYLYINGQLDNSVTYSSANIASSRIRLGTFYTIYTPYYFNGILDEVRIDNIARTAQEIRSAYEVGRRTHPITIDFKANLSSSNLITGSSDTSFTINAVAYGATNAGDNLYEGDKIIVKETVGQTEYIAQGTVTSITSGGTTTVASWDTGSTFPPGGYTLNATVFKWQREYFDLTGIIAGTGPGDSVNQKDAVTRLTLRIIDGSKARNVWLDDIRYSGPYMTTSTGSTITSSTSNVYFQYRAIFSSWDTPVSPSLTSATLDYGVASAIKFNGIKMEGVKIN